MALVSVSGQTAQISTGNVRTNIDVFDSTKIVNGAQNPLGSKYYDVGYTPLSSLGGTAVLTFPGLFGSPVAYRYVRYNSTANVDFQAAPAAVWWTDNTFTTVTSTLSEAFGGTTGGPSYPAGLMMINTTDFPGSLTGAQLKAKVNGNFVWIVVFGLVKGVVSAAAAAGDKLMATQADWSTTGGFSKVTVSAAATSRIFGYAAAASASDVLVVCEGA